MNPYALQPGSKWTAACIVMIGIFITLLDGTIVDVVLPKMMSSLNTDTYGVQWVIISDFIAAAIAMTSVGWLSSVLGHRNTYLLGLVIFTVFSAICGQATSIGMMNVARFCQGIGEGIVVPVGMIILCEVFPRRGARHGPGRLRPGGQLRAGHGANPRRLITEHLSWRWVFYVNLPIGIIGVFLTLMLLWETGKKDASAKSFDLPGFITMSSDLRLAHCIPKQGSAKRLAAIGLHPYRWLSLPYRCRCSSGSNSTRRSRSLTCAYSNTAISP